MAYFGVAHSVPLGHHFHLDCGFGNGLGIRLISLVCRNLRCYQILPMSLFPNLSVNCPQGRVGMTCPVSDIPQTPPAERRGTSLNPGPAKVFPKSVSSGSMLHSSNVQQRLSQKLCHSVVLGDKEGIRQP